MSDELSSDTPETEYAASTDDATAYAKSKQLERERNAALRAGKDLRARLEAWRACAIGLEAFAISYRSHPLRNPKDALDAALATLNRLRKEDVALVAPVVRCPDCESAPEPPKSDVDIIAEQTAVIDACDGVAFADNPPREVPKCEEDELGL